jgi:hypothetical protein
MTLPGTLFLDLKRLCVCVRVILCESVRL